MADIMTEEELCAIDKLYGSWGTSHPSEVSRVVDRVVTECRRRGAEIEKLNADHIKDRALFEKVTRDYAAHIKRNLTLADDAIAMVEATNKEADRLRGIIAMHLPDGNTRQ